MTEVLARRCVEGARKRSLGLAVAESCTGGLVGGALSAIPGASTAFLGGVIAYADKVKISVLGVDEALLRSHGAVSEEVARAMAEGVCRHVGADLGISVTGIAGPTGGGAEKPVGLVHIAVHDRRGEARSLHRRHRFGDIGRIRVRERSAMAALELLCRALEGR